jgi:protein SCO1/2
MKYKIIITILLTTLISLNASDTKIGTFEKLGKYVPMDLVFTNDKGQTETLKKFTDGKPTVISVNYFHCPGLCGPQIDSLAKSLDKLDMKEGKDYKALTISFVPTDTAKDAYDFKRNHTSRIRKNFNPDAWNFLVSNKQETIDKLSKSLGYEYKKIKNAQGFTDYIHPAGLVIISPKGKITRYLSGIQYLPFDLKMALIEATKGTVRPTIARALAFCYSFQPKSGRYVIEYKKIFGVVMTFFMIIIFLYFLITGIKRRKNLKGDDIDE